MPRPNNYLKKPLHGSLLVCLTFALMLPGTAALALKTDRQQPLLINADASEGTLGDGKASLRGNVEIRQGTLLVKADQADVEKADGKVREVLLNGKPAMLQQEIENEGLVTATANSIAYQVATGIVTLTGNADVDHPQYRISGNLLVYDMNQQHFQGSGGDNNGRIRIQLEPEVISTIETKPAETDPAPRLQSQSQSQSRPLADDKTGDEAAVDPSSDFVTDSGSNAPD
jgi:lipopolysaccharide export system protein LptA